VIVFEEKLWLAADKLRGSLDPAEYKHVVLGLIFLKYISDAFEAKHAELVAEDEDAEDRDWYRAENIFWVPPAARWSALQREAKQPEIGMKIDAAMEAIERENPSLKQTLPKEFARPQLDKHRLGELIDLLSGVELIDPENKTKDVLGRVYEYFLSKFASAEGRLGGDFYTPQSVVRVMVEMIEPTKGRVYDPCCGSGGMFVQSEKFVEAHGGSLGDIAVYGQEFNATTWRLAKMNLAIRGIEADLSDRWADTFRQDLHKGLKADYVLANPPFNVSDWGGENLREDARWTFGTPPAGNANFAWMQHILHHLQPERGVGAVVMANGSMSSQQSGEGQIRQRMVEADVVDCLVAMPGQLFYATQIPVCVWVFAKKVGRSAWGDRLTPSTARFLRRRSPSGAARVRSCSSTRASSAPWSTGCTASCRTRTSRASPAPTTRGAARREPAPTRTSRASASRPRAPRSRRTGSCSPPGATSAPRRWRATASRSTPR
jgi:type I restriction enzyme M protein